MISTAPRRLKALVAALETNGHEARFFEASILPPHNLIERLQSFQPDLCFNIAEGHFGSARESQIPALLEMLRIPYTGSEVLTLALALDKPMTKRLLWYHGLPTPEFQVFGRADDPIDEDLLDSAGALRFPLFVKPSREGTGMGVSASSIVRSVEELHQRVAEQIQRYDEPILCERYIEGREITVGVIGNLRPSAARRLNERTAPNLLPDELTFFPTMEINTGAYARTEAGLYTNRMKVDFVNEDYYLCPAELEAEKVQELNLLTAAVFRVLGCRDVARVDFRLDQHDDNKPYILEINPLPGLNPGYSDICIEAAAFGWTYEQLIGTIVDLAIERHGLTINA